jgi:hypothetical protein
VCLVVLQSCLGPENLHEKDWNILMLIYFCMHLIRLLASLLLFSKVFYFLASKLLVIYCLIKGFKKLFVDLSD